MVCESALVAAPVIRGHQVRGLPLVERITLAIFNYLADHLVRAVGGLKIEIVLAGVRPFVGVAKSDIDNFRMVFLYRLQGIGIGKGVKTLLAPVTGHRILHLIEHLQLMALMGGEVRLVCHASGEASPFVVDSVADRFPRGIHHH